MVLADVTSGIERKGGGLLVRPGSEGWEEAKEDKTRANGGDKRRRGHEIYKGKAGRG